MIAKRIKDLRTSHNMTQRELADRLGLTPKMISFYELGQRIPPSDILLKLSTIFTVSVDYLLGNTVYENHDPVFGNHTPINSGRQDPPQLEEESSYYIDPETAALAQDAKDNPDLRILFDASRKLSPKDLKTVTSLVRSLTGEEDG